MAAGAIASRASVAIRVALYTIGGYMCPGQRETGLIMVKTTILVASGVAGEAGGTLINIASNPFVFLIGFRIDMAVNTGK
jgi:hypothetical protein